MIRKTIVAVVALVALGVGMTALASDDSFSFVISDPAGVIDNYRWLEFVPASIDRDLEALTDAGDGGLEIRRFSTPNQRLVAFVSRSCPPLIDIDATAVTVSVTARNPRVDWRCGGYEHIYILELRFTEGTSPSLEVSDLQTSTPEQRR